MLILLGFIIIGALVGIVWGEGASVVKPLGDLFLNLFFISFFLSIVYLTILL